MKRNITFKDCVNNMEANAWNLDEVFNNTHRLDFEKPFLPYSLTLHDTGRPFLEPESIKALNQITTKSYLSFFYFVEEFILQKANQLSHEKDDHAMKDAYNHFSVEEVKHQMLFQRVMRAIDNGLGISPEVLSMSKDFAKDILVLSEPAIMLFILHLEIITQEHFVQSIKGNESVESNIVRVLQHHWIEEAQHANVDYLELKALTETANKAEKTLAIHEYASCLKKLKQGFKLQAQYDRKSLESLCKLNISEHESVLIEQLQYQAYYSLFVRAGLDNQQLISVIDELFHDCANIFQHYRTDPEMED